MKASIAAAREVLAAEQTAETIKSVKEQLDRIESRFGSVELLPGELIESEPMATKADIDRIESLLTALLDGLAHDESQKDAGAIVAPRRGRPITVRS